MKRNSLSDVWKKIAIKGEDDCWEWQGYRTTTKYGKGYGAFGIDGATYLVHRISYLIAHPDAISLAAPKDKSIKEFVLHSCDNMICCNPKHLFLGNYDDNNKDRAKKGRPGGHGAKGHAHKLAKLTHEQVKEIRATLNVPASKIAEAYGISNEVARRVIIGQSYRA